jgi:putative heme-binding domain-containing protein
VPKKRPDALAAALLKVGNNTSASANVRLTALAAVPGGLTSVEPPIFAFVRTHLDREQPVADRALAADVFAHAKLNAEQLVTLAECLKTVGPMEIDRILEAFAQSTEDRVGQNLVQALNASSARAALSVGMLKPRLAKFGAPVQRQAQELYAALEVDTSKQKARLEQLMTSLHGGDVRRGQLVFQGTKGACSSCHAIGYLGGNVGPDLTRIGGIRSDRDLLEAIVFPSASFVRSYEPVLVATKDGKFHNGLIRKETADEIVLATGANQEVRIARTDIEDIQPSKVSVMPSGLDQQLTQRELADLVAFLKACK